jgi:hypothetical protein
VRAAESEKERQGALFLVIFGQLHGKIDDPDRHRQRGQDRDDNDQIAELKTFSPLSKTIAEMVKTRLIR